MITLPDSELVDEKKAKILPLELAVLEQRHRDAKHPALPRSLEYQLAVETRRCQSAVGIEDVHRRVIHRRRPWQHRSSRHV